VVSQLKAVAVNLSRPFGQRGWYASVIGFNPRRFKSTIEGIGSLQQN